MGRGPHLYRRGAVYYWQRRLPCSLAKCLRISHVKVNLRTKNIAVARRLVPLLDARAMELFMGQTEQLSRQPMGEIFKTVLTEHQSKLSLLADLERAKPTTARSTLRDEELAQGTAYKLLAEQGADAQFSLPAQERLMAEGHDLSVVIKAFEHLERLRDENGIKISRQRLADHVKRSGAVVNAINITRAQPIYLHALAAALLDADQRYGNTNIPELDFDALIAEVRGVRAPLESHVKHGEGPAEIELEVQPNIAVEVDIGDAASSILFVSGKLAEKRDQDKEWDAKTSRQALFIYNLLGRYTRDVYQVEDFASVTQLHMAEFDGFLRTLHANFGKSTKDGARTISEIQALAAIEVAKHGALQGPTRNCHLTFLGQLIAYARSGRGLAIDPG